MEKLTTLTRQNTKPLMADMLLALASLAAKHGVQFQLAGGSIAPDGASAQVKFDVVCAAEGDSIPVALFKKNAERLGFKQSDLGREFTARGGRFTIKGLNSARSRNNVIITKVGGTQEFALPHFDVLDALNGPLTKPADASKDEAVRGKVRALLVELGGLPNTPGDFRDRFRKEEEIFQQILAIGEEVGDGLKVGKMISYPVADGKAHYVVMNVGRQVDVAHVPFGDAWTHPIVRNGKMSVGHAQDAIRREDGLRKLFGQKKPAAASA